MTPRRPRVGAHTVSSASTILVTATIPSDRCAPEARTLHSTPGPAAAPGAPTKFAIPGCAGCFTSLRVQRCMPGPTYLSRSNASFSVVPDENSRSEEPSTSSAECLKKPLAPGPVLNAAAKREASLSSCDKVPSIAACACSAPPTSGTTACSTVRLRHSMLPPTLVELTRCEGWITRSWPLCCVTSMGAEMSKPFPGTPRFIGGPLLACGATSLMRSPGRIFDSAHMSWSLTVRTLDSPSSALHTLATTSREWSGPQATDSTIHASSARPSASIRARRSNSVSRSFSTSIAVASWLAVGATAAVAAVSFRLLAIASCSVSAYASRSKSSKSSSH
mmetsp:Transcript_1328/g.5186  ORF Transcript_1328/g.5186 Transcript_1328/m.5186 type:complete len:334 (+) Transcript_1328:1142-2143(+)